MADKKDRFVPIGLNRELYTKELKPGHLLVLQAMITYGKNGEDIYPSVARIAYDTNYGEQNVHLILKDLKRIGVIVRVGKSKYRTITYRINLDVLNDKPPFVNKKQKLRNQLLSVKEKTTEEYAFPDF
jgi:hypothetical protein